MNYNSENMIYFGKNGYSGKNLFGTTKGDKDSLIEKDRCLNKRTKTLLSIAFFVFFSASNFILQLSYALSPFIWPDSFPVIPILSLNLVSAVLNLISLVYFILEDGIDQSFKFCCSLRLFTTSVAIVLILFDIILFVAESHSLQFSWTCASLSLLILTSSYIDGGYFCLKNEKKGEDGH
jgi:hypothetical protein